MGKRGPKPLPKNVLQLRGSWQAKTRVDPSKPAAVESLTPPAWLELSADAHTHWRRVGKVLKDFALLTPLDVVSFGMMSETWALYQRAKRALDASVLLTSDARGAARPNPLHRLLSLERDAYLRLAREFFTTPKSRDRVSVEKFLEDPLPTPAAQSKARFFSSADDPGA